MVFVFFLFVLIIRKLLDLNEDLMEKKEFKEIVDGNEIGVDIMVDYEEDIESYG